MAFIICNIHGGAGAPLVCLHIAAMICENKKLGQISYIDLDGFFFAGWVCPECLNALNLKGLQSYLEKREGNEDYPPAEEIDTLIRDLDLRPVCPKCLEDLCPSLFDSRDRKAKDHESLPSATPSETARRDRTVPIPTLTNPR